MPYPLPSTPPQNGNRLRLLPPAGCPGRGEWVVTLEVALISCPLPITAPRPGDDPPRVGVGLALVAMHGSGAASRGVRWYSAEGPPTLLWQEGAQPPPAPGDLYLDRLSGSIYELEV